MTKDLSNYYTNSFPVSFHVFAIGESFKPIIDRIGTFGYDGVSASAIQPEQLPSPTDNDRMVIILASEGTDSVIDAAKSYYQAGVLTLIGSHRPIESQSKFCDAQLVTDTESMYQSIKVILDMIFNEGLIALDFNDIRSSLHDSGFFKVVAATGSGEEERMAKAISKTENTLSHSEKNAIENLIIAISCNLDIKPPLRMTEMNSLSDFLSTLSVEVNAMWGMFHDDKMPLHEVRLTAMLSGKALQ